MPKVVVVFHPEMAESVDVNLVGPLTAAIPGIEILYVTGRNMRPRDVRDHVQEAVRVIAVYSERFLHGNDARLRVMCFCLGDSEDKLLPVLLPGGASCIFSMPEWMRTRIVGNLTKEEHREQLTAQLIATIQEVSHGS